MRESPMRPMRSLRLSGAFVGMERLRTRMVVDGIVREAEVCGERYAACDFTIDKACGVWKMLV